MVGSRKLLLQAVACGGGFAAATAVIAVGWLGLRHQPHAPAKWNSAAIRATFKTVEVSLRDGGPTATFTFSLENTTDFDCSLDSSSPAFLLAQSQAGVELEPDSDISLTSPLYLPAKRTVVLRIQKQLTYDEGYTKDDRGDLDKLTSFMHRHFDNVAGFVLFNKARRFEIVLPKVGRW